MAGYNEDRRNIIPMFPNRWIPPGTVAYPKINRNEDNGNFPISRAEVEEKINKDMIESLRLVRIHINKTLLKHGFNYVVSIKQFSLSDN